MNNVLTAVCFSVPTVGLLCQTNQTQYQEKTASLTKYEI